MGRPKNKYRMTEALLYNYPHLEAYIKLSLKALKRSDYIELPGIQAYDFTRTRTQNSNINDSTFQEAVKLLNNKKRAIQKIKANNHALNKINAALQYLDEEETKIINKRYFERNARKKSDQEIYEDIGMSESTYYRTKKEAVNKIALIVYG